MATTKKAATKQKQLCPSVGQNYFVRGVTHYYTGKLEAVTDTDYMFSSVAWIADTGRFSEALASGSFNEVEPYPDDVIVMIPRGSIVDMSTWAHPLPRGVK